MTTLIVADILLAYTLAVVLHDASGMSDRYRELGLYDDLDHRA